MVATCTSVPGSPRGDGHRSPTSPQLRSGTANRYDSSLTSAGRAFAEWNTCKIPQDPVSLNQTQFSQPQDGGTRGPSQLTPEQRAEALKKAAEARKARAELKEKLKRGGTDLKQVLADADEDPIIGKMKVSALPRGPAEGGQGQGTGDHDPARDRRDPPSARPGRPSVSRSAGALRVTRHSRLEPGTAPGGSCRTSGKSTVVAGRSAPDLFFSVSWTTRGFCC